MLLECLYDTFLKSTRKHKATIILIQNIYKLLGYESKPPGEPKIRLKNREDKNPCNSVWFLMLTYRYTYLQIRVLMCADMCTHVKERTREEDKQHLLYPLYARPLVFTFSSEPHPLPKITQTLRTSSALVLRLFSLQGSFIATPLCNIMKTPAYSPSRVFTSLRLHCCGVIELWWHYFYYHYNWGKTQMTTSIHQ